MKALIFDSGTLITFSMNCSLDILRELKKKFNGKFLITNEVKKEVVDRPLGIKKYKLGALRISNLIDEGILEYPEAVGISSKEVTKLCNDVLKDVNSYLYSQKRSIHLIDLGESSILALSKLLSEKKIENMIAIDERTTRLFIENKDNLKMIIEQKVHMALNSGQLHIQIPTVYLVRSTELIYLAYKFGFFKNNSKEYLDAMLYGAKFKGASISSDEIKEIERI